MTRWPQPIETVYAATRFRSRTEARWAVFFDAIGIPWVYEPEAFALQAGNYLPDFYLPSMDLWVECKPENYSENDSRHFEFAAVHPFALLVGNPRSEMQDNQTFWPEPPGLPVGWDTGYVFAKCDECGTVSYDFPGGSDPHWFSRCRHSWRSRYGLKLRAAYAEVAGTRFWEPHS